MKKFLLAGAVAAGVFASSCALAATCQNTNAIIGEIRYDAGSSNCYRAIVDATGAVKTTGGAVTGAVTPAPTGQSQYGLTPTAGFASDGVTAITGAAACSILKPAAGNAFWVGGYVSAGGVWAQIYDSATIPADATLTYKSSGGTLVESIYISTTGNWLRTFGGGTYPAVFAAGVTVCVSTTGPFVKTQLAAAGTNTIQGAVQ